MTIQEEIREDLLKIVRDEGNYPTYEETVDQILQYLDGKGVGVRVCEKGETAWTKIPYEYCKWERLVKE